MQYLKKENPHYDKCKRVINMFPVVKLEAVHLKEETFIVLGSFTVI